MVKEIELTRLDGQDYAPWQVTLHGEHWTYTDTLSKDSLEQLVGVWGQYNTNRSRRCGKQQQIEMANFLAVAPNGVWTKFCKEVEVALTPEPPANPDDWA